MASILRPDSGEYHIIGNTDIDGNTGINGDLSVSGSISGMGITTSDTLVELIKTKITDITDVNLESPTDSELPAPALDVLGGGRINGNLYIGGTLLVNGDVITLGNTGGEITFNSNIASDILPTTTLTYDIGSQDTSWKNVYCDDVIKSQNTATTEVDTGSIVYLDGNSNETYTMSDATVVGTTKTILVKEEITTTGGSIVVTPTNTLGFTSFTFSNIGDSITLLYTDSGWAITSLFRTSVNN